MFVHRSPDAKFQGLTLDNFSFSFVQTFRAQSQISFFLLIFGFFFWIFVLPFLLEFLDEKCQLDRLRTTAEVQQSPSTTSSCWLKYSKLLSQEYPPKARVIHANTVIYS